MEPVDILAVGDTTTDAFIRLKDAKVHCTIKKESCELCVRFGDKIPYEFVEIVKAVGNAANVAVCASRLGVKSALFSRLGSDEIGKESLEHLKSEGVDTTLTQIEEGKKSNYHYVLWYEDDRTILVQHETYHYSLPENFLAPKWLYLTSLGASAEKFHDEIVTYLSKHPQTKLAFQPGTFQLKFGINRFKQLYARTEILFVNAAEARLLLDDHESEPQALPKLLSRQGPKIVVVTDGPKGAYVYDGAKTFFMPPYPDPKPPYERTGTGDAFAGTVVSALTLGNNLESAVAWGAINSMSVVQYIGAQKGLLKRTDVETFFKNAPINFTPRST